MSTKLIFDDQAYLDKMRQKYAYINHIHWDGSIPAEDLFKFYQKQNDTLFLPETDVAGNKIVYVSEQDQLIDSVDKLREFQNGLLTKYGIVDVFAVPVGAMQTKEALKQMAVAHCKYLKSQKIPFSETRFAPLYHTKQGLTMDQVIGYALEGFAQGKEESGVVVQPIICINREVDVETAEQIVDVALNFEDRGIIGIDLACFEPGSPPEKFSSAFRKTWNSSLKRTAHAGEMCDEEENMVNIYTALTELKVDGISHALPLYKYPDLISMFIDGHIRLESNPISNARFFVKEVAELHLDDLVNWGVLVTINPDDPAMWPNGDLAHNLYVLGKLYGDKFIDQVIKNSIDASWRI